MEVKVDSNLIRVERENRGWSQGHLAEVAGLSLRTIQRIEKTGSASFESVTALASVLEIGVAALRTVEATPPQARALRLSFELPMRVALAVGSGALCALLFRWRLDNGWMGFGLPDVGASGASFGAAILCPYLVPGRRLIARALALIGASAFSYFCAVLVFLNADSLFSVSDELAAFLLASFVGVTIVFIAAKLLIPLRVTAAFWLLGLAASLVGGLAMYAGFHLLGDTVFTNVAGFSVWHVAACLAIHRGRASSDAESGLLAAFAKARGRFSIVAGWMNRSCSSLLTSA